MEKQILIYQTRMGIEPYTKYLSSLLDYRGAAKIRVRVERAALGNLGDCKSVGEGVIELRIQTGPGYRVYAGLHGEEIVVLLCAGDKSTQDKDIRLAKYYWEDFKEERMRHYRTHKEYLHNVLKDPKEAALYLNAVIDENDPALLVSALADVARAHGISHLARKASISRVGLHKALSKKGNPELKTFMNLVKATGLQMTFKTAA